MASNLIFTCDKCGFSVESWDDGHPYIEFPKGKRNYYYHPGEMDVISEMAEKILGHEANYRERDEVLRKYGGAASDFICRKCEHVSILDSAKDRLICSVCGSEDVQQTWTLAKSKCIRRDDTFSEGYATQFHEHQTSNTSPFFVLARRRHEFTLGTASA